MPDSLPSVPSYRVSIWEGIAIAVSAVLLTAVGLAGLSVKALNNAFDPQRAEAIARSMVDYAIPGGAKGLFGSNVGGGKMAVVGSTTQITATPPNANPIAIPNVEFLIAQIPLPTGTDVEDEFSDEPFFPGFSFSNQTVDAFQVKGIRTEEQAFCGAIAPVKIEEGTLVLADQVAPVAAVRYEAKVTLNADEHIAIVSAAGEKAKENAAIVFQSLKCKP